MHKVGQRRAATRRPAGTRAVAIALIVLPPPLSSAGSLATTKVRAARRAWQNLAPSATVATTEALPASQAVPEAAISAGARVAAATHPAKAASAFTPAAVTLPEATLGEEVSAEAGRPHLRARLGF